MFLDLFHLRHTKISSAPVLWLVKQYIQTVRSLLLPLFLGNVTMDSVHSFRRAQDTTERTSACLVAIKEPGTRSCREAMSITQNTKY